MDKFWASPSISKMGVWLSLPQRQLCRAFSRVFLASVDHMLRAQSLPLSGESFLHLISTLSLFTSADHPQRETSCPRGSFSNEAALLLAKPSSFSFSTQGFISWGDPGSSPISGAHSLWGPNYILPPSVQCAGWVTWSLWGRLLFWRLVTRWGSLGSFAHHLWSVVALFFFKSTHCFVWVRSFEKETLYHCHKWKACSK